MLCKDLISNLHLGMQGLQQFAARENVDPNSKIVKVVTDQNTGATQFQHQALGPNFEAQSVRDSARYNWSAVGEMNTQELDQLYAQNEKRLEVLEEQYGESTAIIAEQRKEARKKEAENF